MKRPAIQLYFGDLMKNPKVKRCGWAARGVLIWTMALLHDEEEYGAVRWPLIEIAQAVGCPFTLMRELADKGALKGGDKRVEAYRWAPSHAGKRGPEVILVPEQEGPLWYSSRMVRDEYKRTKCGIGTRFGTSGKLPTGTPDTSPSGTPSRANGDGDGSPSGPPNRGEGDGASSSSSSSTKQCSEPPTSSRDPLQTEKSTAGHNNGLQKQPFATRSPEGAKAKAESLGMRTMPGETTEQLVARINMEIAQRERHA